MSTAYNAVLALDVRMRGPVYALCNTNYTNSINFFVLTHTN